MFQKIAKCNYRGIHEIEGGKVRVYWDLLERKKHKSSNPADFITGFEPNKYVFHFLDSNHFTHINYRW